MFDKLNIHFFLKLLLKAQLGLILIISLLVFYTKDERYYNLEKEKLAIVIKPLFTFNSGVTADFIINDSNESLINNLNYINSFCSNISQNKSNFSQQKFSNRDIALTKLKIESEIKLIDKNCNFLREEVQSLGDYKNLNMESYANKKILASIQKETNNIVTAYREIVNLSKSMLERPISKLYQLFKILQYAMLFNLFLSFIILCFKKDKSISLEIYYRNKFRLATIFATLSFSVYLIFKIFIDISLFFPLFFVLFFLQSLFYASKYSRCI